MTNWPTHPDNNSPTNPSSGEVEREADLDVAHYCNNGTLRPYPAVLCSSCKYVTHNLSVRELCKQLNACSPASTAPGVDELQRELAFYFGQYHETLGHREDALQCMVNECARVRNLCLAPKVPPTTEGTN